MGANRVDAARQRLYRMHLFCRTNETKSILRLHSFHEVLGARTTPHTHLQSVTAQVLLTFLRLLVAKLVLRLLTLRRNSQRFHDNIVTVSKPHENQRRPLILKAKLGEDCGIEQVNNYNKNNVNQFKKQGHLQPAVPPLGPGVVTMRSKVQQTLRIFQTHCRMLMREEESKPSSKANEVKKRGPKQRVDLLSAKILKEKNLCVNTEERYLGEVPGVEVGDEFHYRVELAIIGLHRPYMAGIDSMIWKGIPVATSIVSSGCYSDYMDSSDVLIYSGQGGHPIPGSKITVPTDQKLERGNLALKNSIDAKTPVRVIRGFRDTSADAKINMAATLTYDGLYRVEKYWKQMGEYRTYVYMFQLRRIPGQPQLAIKELKKSSKAKVREGVCVKDITQGKEKMPIAALNTIDDSKPPSFVYLTKMVHPQHLNPIPARGCSCVGRCSISSKCSCAIKNGDQIPFNYNGLIVEAKPLVYECGPKCGCPPSCYNRVSQRGIRFQLEIFKTEFRGWGVRSLDSIPSGSFVCEYTGEFLRDEEAEKRTGDDEYLFDIGNNYNHDELWGELSKLVQHDTKMGSSCEAVEDSGFTIDAANYGNIGRFINHSCSPNLYAQNVLYDHHDKRMPHIMLFAAENIPPLRELTYHYNYQLDQIFDANGNIKKKSCYCGSKECTGRMY